MIYKYKIARDMTLVNLPLGSSIISAGTTNGDLVVWADVTEEKELESHVVHAVFTGEDAPYNCTFIGTVVITRTLFKSSAVPIEDYLVYHVFESNL